MKQEDEKLCERFRKGLFVAHDGEMERDTIVAMSKLVDTLSADLARTEQLGNAMAEQLENAIELLNSSDGEWRFGSQALTAWEQRNG